jgi:hypothetical protein
MADVACWIFRWRRAGVEPPAPSERHETTLIDRAVECDGE